MITFILTGHGHFASGVASAVELIAGEQEAFEAIDFDGYISPEELTEQYRKAIEKHGNKEVIILSDLVSGTPFRSASILKCSLTDYHIEVLTGTNLGLLLEGLMSRSFMEEAEGLAIMLLETGRNQLIRFEMPVLQAEESEDGI